MLRKQVHHATDRTLTLAGSLATALDSLSAGAIVQALQRNGAMTDVSSYRLVILVYAPWEQCSHS